MSLLIKTLGSLDPEGKPLKLWLLASDTTPDNVWIRLTLLHHRADIHLAKTG